MSNHNPHCPACLDLISSTDNGHLAARSTDGETWSIIEGAICLECAKSVMRSNAADGAVVAVFRNRWDFAQHKQRYQIDRTTRPEGVGRALAGLINSLESDWF